MRVATLPQMLRALRIVTTVAFVMGLLAPAALAQSGPEPGVTVDPNSPAGKEYALPVPKARQDAQGKTKKKSSSDAPLFGQGVKPKPKARAATPKTSQQTQTQSQSATPSRQAAPAAQPATTGTTRATTKNKRQSSAKRKAAKRNAAAKRKKTAASAAKNAETTGPTTQAAVPAPTDVANIAAGANDPASGGGFGTTLLIVGAGIGLLVVAGLGGLLLRRLGRSA
jgi:hypothetical protein